MKCFKHKLIFIIKNLKKIFYKKTKPIIYVNLTVFKKSHKFTLITHFFKQYFKQILTKI